MTKITDKLFAHIQNDAYLIGSRTLEGEDFEHTTSYLLDYVISMQLKGHEYLDEELSKKIEPLIFKIEHLNRNAVSKKMLNRRIKGLTETEVGENQHFKDYTERLASEVKAILNDSIPQNSLMIPGGWLNSDGGHAMVYEFKRNEQGHLLFVIHNSGAGLNYHNRISQEDKERYCPVKVYKINDQELDEDRLAWFIGELVKPNLSMKEKKDVTAKQLYSSVFPQIAFLNGELEDPFLYTHEEHLIMGQRSGTCAEKILHVMLKDAISDKKEYKKFIYNFKKHALNEYVEKIQKENRQNDAGVTNQILLAVANMSRMLLKEDYFDNKKREAELTYLKGVQNDIQMQAPTPVAAIKKTIQIEELVSQSQPMMADLKVPPSLPTVDTSSETKPYESVALLAELHFDFDQSDFIEALKEFNHETQLLAKQDSVSAYLSVEKFLMRFTDDLEQRMQEYGSSGDIESKKELLDLMSELNEVYVAAYRETNKSRVTPQFYVAELGLLSILSYIETTENAEEELNSPPMLELVRLAMSKNLNVILDKLEFVSEDYLCDKKLLELIDLLTDKRSKVSRYNEENNKTKQLYEQMIKQNGLFDGLVEYYNEFCEINKFTNSQKVCDRGQNDSRGLFMVQKYLALGEYEKHSFFEGYCTFHQIHE